MGFRPLVLLVITGYLSLSGVHRALANSGAPIGASSGLPHKRAEALRRTINVWRWFAREQDSSRRHYQRYLSDNEIAQIKGWGFSAVRLPVREPFLFASVENASRAQHKPENIKLLIDAITRLHHFGLAAIVDFHSKDRAGMESDANYRRAITTLWGDLAKELSGLDPEITFFEMLNEPRFIKSEETWYEWQRELLTTIRANAPRHTIIATAVEYSDPIRLSKMQPLPDTNVIYTFHTYDPILFAHQGADFFKRRPEEGVRGLPWPATEPHCEDAARHIEARDGRAIALKYCAAGWDRERLKKFLEPAFGWARIWNVPLFVGEFGVRIGGTDYESRNRWLRDAVSIFEEQHAAWALWSYDDCYGLALKVDGNCRTASGTGSERLRRAQATLNSLGLAGQKSD